MIENTAQSEYDCSASCDSFVNPPLSSPALIPNFPKTILRNVTTYLKQSIDMFTCSKSPSGDPVCPTFNQITQSLMHESPNDHVFQ